MELRIVPATQEHIQGIADIYNEAIANTTATFDTDPKTLDDRGEWLAAHGDRFPVLVALAADPADCTVLGWASVSEYSPRPAYRFTGEESVYVRADARGQGIGKALLGALVEQARARGFRTLIGRVVAGNAASERAHACCGFEEVGRLREVGSKFGLWLDVLFLQVML
jgi:L-amino acid N-acyltransferase